VVLSELLGQAFRTRQTTRPISSDEVFKPRKARRRRATPRTRKSVRVATALHIEAMSIFALRQLRWIMKSIGINVFLRSGATLHLPCEAWLVTRR